jgi:hypothetical protein
MLTNQSQHSQEYQEVGGRGGGGRDFFEGEKENKYAELDCLSISPYPPAAILCEGRALNQQLIFSSARERNGGRKMVQDTTQD